MSSISRRKFIKRTAVITTGLAVTSSVNLFATQTSETKPPNLIFVFPDAMRQQSLGFLKQDPVITPNLDKFASQGLFLPNAVSNNPVCSPYRAMLLTGKYSYSNGVTINCFNHQGKKTQKVELKATERCISDVLHDEGYNQGYIGKWHLDYPEMPFSLEVWGSKEKGDLRAFREYTTPGARRHGFDFLGYYRIF